VFLLYLLSKIPFKLRFLQLNATSLEVISRHDMARKVPIGSSITFEELAAQCDLYESDVRRIIRFAIAHHFVFREPRKGFVAHSAASRRLVDDQGARDGFGLMFNDCYQSFARVRLICFALSS
jgi:hypothetical protein